MSKAVQLHTTCLQHIYPTLSLPQPPKETTYKNKCNDNGSSTTTCMHVVAARAEFCGTTPFRICLAAPRPSIADFNAETDCNRMKFMLGTAIGWPTLGGICTTNNPTEEPLESPDPMFYFCRKWCARHGVAGMGAHNRLTARIARGVHAHHGRVDVIAHHGVAGMIAQNHVRSIGCTSQHGRYGCTSQHGRYGCTSQHGRYDCTSQHGRYGCTSQH
eukprot:351281-Chlamydomonas_euryale.AAC.3